MIPEERKMEREGEDVRRREMGKERERKGVKTKWEGGIIMSPTSDTSSCFYGDQGANRVALLRTVLLGADQRV